MIPQSESTAAGKLLAWCLCKYIAQQNLLMAIVDPGKPWQNGTAESFNGKFRDECLSMEWFSNRLEAKVVIEQWRLYCNQVRPHSGLGKQTPAAFKNSSFQQPPPESFSKNEWPEEIRLVSARKKPGRHDVPTGPMCGALG
jgi:putative transposase